MLPFPLFPSHCVVGGKDSWSLTTSSSPSLSDFLPSPPPHRRPCLVLTGLFPLDRPLCVLSLLWWLCRVKLRSRGDLRSAFQSLHFALLADSPTAAKGSAASLQRRKWSSKERMTRAKLSGHTSPLPTLDLLYHSPSPSPHLLCETPMHRSVCLGGWWGWWEWSSSAASAHPSSLSLPTDAATVPGSSSARDESYSLFHAVGKVCSVHTAPAPAV